MLHGYEGWVGFCASSGCGDGVYDDTVIARRTCILEYEQVRRGVRTKIQIYIYTKYSSIHFFFPLGLCF